MLDNKQIRMLELLDEQILKCKRCKLHSGGYVTPYWTSLSKYVIIGEAPGREEVENNEPFIGKAGRTLWDVMSKYGFRKEEFLIVNSVQCRPTDGKKNLKPNTDQIFTCKKIWRKYIKVVNPYRMIVLGNYANGAIGNYDSGILSRNGHIENCGEFDIEYVSSIHPSYCTYNKDGIKLLNKSINEFRKMGEDY